MSAANLYYVDLYNGRPANEAGQAATFPEVVAGGTISFALRFLEYYGAYTEKDQHIAALRVGLGPVDARPTGGHFSIKVGAGATVVGTNTTSPMPYNATAAQVAAALNALPQGNNFVVSHESGSYVIRRTNGAATTLTVAQNKLEPVSFGRIMARLSGAEWTYELRLAVAPLAFSDSAARILPDAPVITTLRDGGVDQSGTIQWNEIQELHVPRNWRGTYQIRYGQFAKTELLDPLDGATQIQRAINAMLTLKDGTKLGEVTVTNPRRDYAHIEFGGDLGGTDVEQMQVTVFSAPFGDWTFDLPLNRYELFQAFRNADVLTLPFEAEADFYLDGNDHSAGIVTRKLWQTTLRVRRPQIMPDMAVVPGVDWLRVNPEDYVPFAPGQIVTGPQTYSTTIGNGSSSSFTITHGLNTQAIANIIVRHNTAQWTALTEGVDFNATINNANEVQLVFGTAPALNSLLVYVQSAPASRQWDAHTHTQEQIIGLPPLLENMIQRISILELLIPKPGVAGMVGGDPQEFTMPGVGEILPDFAVLEADETIASQIVVGPRGNQTNPEGTAAAQAIEDQKETEKQIEKDPDALPANVLYRVLIPGVGKTASRGKATVFAADGTVAIPAVPDTPSEPAVWPARSAAMAKGGRWPLLLPAIQSSEEVPFGTAVSFGSALVMPPPGGFVIPPLPIARENAGKVWVSNAKFLLPGEGGRKSQPINAGDRFASDGRVLYRVNPGSDNWYFPAEMDRELWRVFLGEDQFADGATLSVSGQIRSRMLGDFFDDDARGIGRVDLGAQYMIVCEAVPVFGTAVVGQAGTPVVLGSSRITLSPSQETFRWSLSIRRESQTMVSAWTAYRKSIAGPNFTLPASLRLRLTRFDVDDAAADPRGQVAIIMPPTKLDIIL